MEQLRANFYLLKGGGGNTALFVTTTGVVIVDTKSEGWGQAILNVVTDLTPMPVTTIINTHAHIDQVGGNAEFPAPVEVVAQHNTVVNMVTMDVFKKSGARGLPRRSFQNQMTIGTGADRVDLYYFGRGHTNGDAVVVFPSLRLAYAGDLFPDKCLPVIDRAGGGGAQALSATLQSAHDGISNVDQVITGHGAVMTWDDLQDYAQFTRHIVAWGENQRAAGKSATEAATNFAMSERYRSDSCGGAGAAGGLL